MGKHLLTTSDKLHQEKTGEVCQFAALTAKARHSLSLSKHQECRCSSGAVSINNASGELRDSIQATTMP